MISELKDTPNSMVGFKATDDITKDDFDKVILPAVAELVQRTGKLNYLLILDTSLKNFTIGAWMKDAMLGLNNLTNWNRAAFVTDSAQIKLFTGLFSKIVPGEFRVYEYDELQDAIKWVSEKDLNGNKQVFQNKADVTE